MATTQGKRKFVIAISIAVTGSETGHHYFESVKADGFFREEAFVIFYNEEIEDNESESTIKQIAIFKKWDYFFEDGVCE